MVGVYKYHRSKTLICIKNGEMGAACADSPIAAERGKRALMMARGTTNVPNLLRWIVLFPHINVYSCDSA